MTIHVMRTVCVVTTRATMKTTTIHAILNQKWFPSGDQQIPDHLAVRKFRTSQVDYWVTRHKVLKIDWCWSMRDDYLLRKVLLVSKCLSLKTLLLREKSRDIYLFIHLQNGKSQAVSAASISAACSFTPFWLTSPVSAKSPRLSPAYLIE